MYCCNVSRAHRQKPPNPTNWTLVCIKVKDWFYTEISLSFGLRWPAVCSQDVTFLIVKHLVKYGLHILNYIDDFGGTSSSKFQVDQHFGHMCATLKQLGLHESAHKSCLPVQHMICLGFEFDTNAMTSPSQRINCWILSR